MGVWIETHLRLQIILAYIVTPHVGVWIETWSKRGRVKMAVSHSPRGSVD